MLLCDLVLILQTIIKLRCVTNLHVLDPNQNPADRTLTLKCG